MIKIDLNDLDKFFVKGELIPAICYEVNTKTVLMLAYMNKESLKKTLETGYTWFWSRSRQEYWNKGATSGHLQKVVSIYGDCDNDTLLVNVEQTGVACHTGSYSCFWKFLRSSRKEKSSSRTELLLRIHIPAIFLTRVSTRYARRSARKLPKLLSLQRTVTMTS